MIVTTLPVFSVRLTVRMPFPPRYTDYDWSLNNQTQK